MSRQIPNQVSLRDVSRAYGRSFALHRANLTLNSGSIAAIVGGNGAGKSTLLNLLATIDQPTSGTISYDDVPVARFAKKARHRIGWVSHHALLYEELTARENLAFFANMYGLTQIDDRIASWLERVDLIDDADRQVRTFSRGMKQRLTIARALLHNPQLLLLDEPATGLDQQGSQFVADLLRKLRARNRIIIIVTHDFELLRGLADRLIILSRGKIAFDEEVDSSSDLLAAYRSHS